MGSVRFLEDRDLEECVWSEGGGGGGGDGVRVDVTVEMYLSVREMGGEGMGIEGGGGMFSGFGLTRLLARKCLGEASGEEVETSG